MKATTITTAVCDHIFFSSLYRVVRLYSVRVVVCSNMIRTETGRIKLLVDVVGYKIRF